MTFKFLLPAAIGCALVAIASKPANAIIAIFSAAEFTSTVTDLGGGQFLYAYTLLNNRGCTSVGCNIAPYDSQESALTDFYLPLFPDANITDITSPAGWSERTDAVDLFVLGDGAEAMHWTGSLAPLSTASGFSFVTTFAPVKASVQEIFQDSATETIDPPIPGSPDAIGAGLTQSLPVTTPEPRSLLGALGLSFALLAVCRARLRRIHQ